MLQIHRMRAIVFALTAVFIIGQLCVPAVASTVSTISGTVTDSTTGKPIAGVVVTAVSQSARLSATTDVHGFYSMTGVPTDEYTVSFKLNGYEPVTVTGVAAFADQIATANASMVKSLKTIATVSARGAAGAFQPNNTADTFTVNANQINNINGSPFNLSEGNLLRALPGVSYSIGDVPTIRGGRTDMVDYEFEGIPYTDPYLNKYINDLSFPGFGLQSVQLSPGSEDASFGNSGDGTVNVIARQGSYHGGADIGAVVGGPGFLHGLNLGYGAGAPNNRWTDYASYTAQDAAPQYGGPYAYLPANQLGILGGISYTADREFTNNFIYNFGRNQKYSLQYFVDTSYHRADGVYGEDLADQCFTTYAPPLGQPDTCENSTWGYLVGMDGNGYGAAPNGGYAQTGITSAEYQELLALQPGQTANQLESNFQQIGRPGYQEYYNGSGTKLQLSEHISPSTYAFINYYNALGVDISDEECCAPDPGGNAIWRNQGGWTNGGNIGLDTQLSDKNLLKFGGTYTNLNPHNEGLFNTDEMWNLTVYGDNAWEIYDFIPPNQYCPLGDEPGTTKSACGYLYSYFPGSSLIKLPAGTSAAVLTSRGGAAYVTDSWQPNSKLHVDTGLRMDTMSYNLPPEGVLPNCTTDYFPVYVEQPNAQGLINGMPVGPGNCPKMLFAPITSAQSNPHIVQPRIAAAFEMDANDAIRASFGRTVRFIHGEEMDYTAEPDFASEFNDVPAYLNPAVNAWAQKLGLCSTGINCLAPAGYQTNTYKDVPVECGYIYYGAAVPCSSYEQQLYWSEINDDFAFPITPLKPVIANNWDASYEHQFAHGWSTRVTPWARRTYDLDVLLPIVAEDAEGRTIINPSTGQPELIGPEAISNNGLEIAKGIEFLLTKESRYGFSGSFTADLTSVRQNVDPTTSDEFHGLIGPDVSAFPTLTYRVPYVAPFTSALAVAYTTHSGWRLQTTMFYTGGYPYGPGLYVPYQVAGIPEIIPNTNATGSGGTTGQFIDPSNPGSLKNPNIAANLGTPDGTYPDGVLTHPDLTAEVTLEKSIGLGKIGVEVFNLFNDPYPGPTFAQGTFGVAGPYALTSGSPLYSFGAFGLNPAYQPVATGVSGPLTGKNASCLLVSGACTVIGNGPYVHYPNAQGLNFFVYYTTRI